MSDRHTYDKQWAHTAQPHSVMAVACPKCGDESVVGVEAYFDYNERPGQPGIPYGWTPLETMFSECSCGA